MARKILAIVLIVFTISLGFIRDSTFVSINKVIQSGGDINGALVNYKWILTCFFSVVYLLCTGLVVYFLFNSKEYMIIAVVLYGILFGVSAIAVLCSNYFSSFGNVYPFVRMLMGVAQSPVIMMVLIAFAYLDRKWLRKK